MIQVDLFPELVKVKKRSAEGRGEGGGGSSPKRRGGEGMASPQHDSDALGQSGKQEQKDSDETLLADLATMISSGTFHAIEAKEPRKMDGRMTAVPSPAELGIPEPTFLAAKNCHRLDKTIRFVEDSHKYYVQWLVDLTKKDEAFTSVDTVSVSGFVHAYFEAFDADTIIDRMQKGKNFSAGKYAGMSKQEIKDQWTANGNTASRIGTNSHYLLELYHNGDIDLQGKFGHLKIVQDFFKWKMEVYEPMGLVPFRTEMRLRSDATLKLTGTADLLCVKADHGTPEETGSVLSVHVIDW
jgi:hypothetical protein